MERLRSRGKLPIREQNLPKHFDVNRPKPEEKGAAEPESKQKPPPGPEDAEVVIDTGGTLADDKPYPAGSSIALASLITVVIILGSLLAGAIGIAVGALSAWRGGVVDRLLMSAADALSADELPIDDASLAPASAGRWPPPWLWRRPHRRA